jgi:hypothetical protein
MAFAYGSGNQSAGSNDYNISPGSPNSAWRVAATQGQCGVERFAVGGGPKGFGVLEQDDVHNRTVYQPFNQSTLRFGPMVTVSNQPELSPSLSQDGSNGIYATYFNNGSGGPVALSYSSDGGATWSGPAVLDPYDGQADVTSSVNGSGQGWAAWANNGSVFAESFNAADSAGPPAVSGSASTDGSRITVTVTCSAFPCTVTITITGPPKVAADAARKGRHKAKPTVLAKGRFTITKAGAHKLTMRLTGAGKRFFKSHHGTVKVKGQFAAAFKGRIQTVSKTIRVKFVKSRHHGR